MLKIYHQKITTEALQAFFSPQALQTIIAANLGQDGLRCQIGHPEYHFDDNQFAAGEDYLHTQRGQILNALANGHSLNAAWRAFGRLTHAAQDFYAHSNYVSLWIELKGHRNGHPRPEEIDPLKEDLLTSKRLRSGRIYFPWEFLSFLPGMEKTMRRWLPQDSHTWMNLDSPERGPNFAYAYAAARKRTVYEYEQLAGMLQSGILANFCGKDPAN